MQIPFAITFPITPINTHQHVNHFATHHLGKTPRVSYTVSSVILSFMLQFVPAKNEASRGAKTHGMTTRRSALGNITNQQGGMDPSVKAHKAKATSSNSIKTSVPQQRIGEVKARSSSTRNVARSSSTTTRTQKMHHVDLADRMDPQTAAEYAQDIFNYHRQVEVSTQARLISLLCAHVACVPEPLRTIRHLHEQAV